MRPAWAIGALVVAAAIQLVVTLAPDAYSILGPYFLVDGLMVRRALESIVPFGLAAAILVGAGRWSGGRAHLWRGAAALAVAGLAQLASDVIFATWAVSGEAGVFRVWLPALFIVRTGASAVAFGLLAAGLWAAGQPRDEPAESHAVVRPSAGAAIGVLGAVCAAGTAWTVLAASGSPREFVIFMVAGVLLVAAGIGALALLAIVALRVRPSTGALPELLIAVGSTIAMLGLTGQWVVPYGFPTGTPPELGLVFGIVGWSRVIGFVALAAGFLTAVGTERTTAVQAA